MLANSALSGTYFGGLNVKLGGLSVLHWVNDALMAVFFLLVGLEIKRELLIGQLSTWPSRILPGMAAVGGMVVPAAVFVILNWQYGINLRGWAIPTATDIAFALGVLALLGSRVPMSLKIFLTALAILDDLGAVLVIAAFYTANLEFGWLAAAAVIFILLSIANGAGFRSLPLYLLLGVLLWFFVLRSGVHATIAGVLLAFTIPLAIQDGLREHSPLTTLEHALAPWVAFLIVPIFGFANAGVSLQSVTLASLAAPLTLGVALGLFIGKQIGVFATTFAMVKLRFARLPDGANWMHVYGVAMLCGIGFTMSLFIGLLAYADAPALQDEMKIGVLLGSIMSAVAGSIVLAVAGRKE
jgi:NhaA family Na+:H+ antiporter